MTSARPAVRCKARSPRTGQPCRAYAMYGQTVCMAHGGRARQNKAAGARRVADAKARKVLAKYATPRGDATPSAMLVEELQRAAGHVQWLEDRLRRDPSPLSSSEWALFGVERDRLSRLATDLARLGIERSLLTSELERMWREAIDGSIDAAVALLLEVLVQIGVARHAFEVDEGQVVADEAAEALLREAFRQVQEEGKAGRDGSVRWRSIPEPVAAMLAAVKAGPERAWAAERATFEARIASLQEQLEQERAQQRQSRGDGSDGSASLRALAGGMPLAIEAGGIIDAEIVEDPL